MEYLRRQQLLNELERVRPGLGAELGRFPISTAAEVEQLQALLEEHQQVMSGYATLQSDYRRQADEYRRQAALLETKVAAACSGARLSAPGLTAARLLATVANALGLHTTAEGAMVAAWVAKDAEMVRQERVQAKREAIASELRHEAEAASSLVSELTAQVEAARRAQEVVEGGMDVLETETHNMHLKAIEYEQRIASTEERLKSLGYRPELGHLALEAMAEQVDSLERSLAETEEALKRYDSIPPSAAGLAAMLEHSQKELAEVHAAMGSAFVHGGPGLAAAARGGSGGGLGGRGGGGGVGPGAFGFGGGGA